MRSTPTPPPLSLLERKAKALARRLAKKNKTITEPKNKKAEVTDPSLDDGLQEQSILPENEQIEMESAEAGEQQAGDEDDNFPDAVTFERADELIASEEYQPFTEEMACKYKLTAIEFQSLWKAFLNSYREKGYTAFPDEMEMKLCFDDFLAEAFPMERFKQKSDNLAPAKPRKSDPKPIGAVGFGVLSEMAKISGEQEACR